jgi:hypothetical protein
MASEVCVRDIPYVEQHAQRKIIDDTIVAARVNMAVCYMRIHEIWKAKEAAGGSHAAPTTRQSSLHTHPFTAPVAAPTL